MDANGSCGVGNKSRGGGGGGGASKRDGNVQGRGLVDTGIRGGNIVMAATIFLPLTGGDDVGSENGLGVVPSSLPQQNRPLRLLVSPTACLKRIDMTK